MLPEALLTSHRVLAVDVCAQVNKLESHALVAAASSCRAGAGQEQGMDERHQQKHIISMEQHGEQKQERMCSLAQAQQITAHAPAPQRSGSPRCSAVRPSLSVRCMSAPRSTSRSTTCRKKGKESKWRWQKSRASDQGTAEQAGRHLGRL